MAATGFSFRLLWLGESDNLLLWGRNNKTPLYFSHTSPEVLGVVAGCTRPFQSLRRYDIEQGLAGSWASQKELVSD